MCGICGYIAREQGWGSKTILQQMSDKLIHRGPDDEGYYINRGVGLCHRRLSILDLTVNGHQPMVFGDYVLVYNGEIYNYLELKEELIELGYHFDTSTDTEVLLASYKEWGKECLNKFNGMWAFALWDSKKRILFCARDRWGVKPFYYHIDKKRFLFASEIKALLCDKGIRRVANDPIVYDYLTQGLVEHTNETFYKDIYKLPASCYMIIDENLEYSIEKYYELEFEKLIGGKLTDSEIMEFRCLFEDSVNVRLRADVEVGTCLSGGLDSSSIVCCMNKLLQKKKNGCKQHTFSFCANDNRIDETKYIDEVVKNTQVQSHRIHITEGELESELENLIYCQDEPFSSTGMYAGYCVYRNARENGIEVLLDGQGADEILCGYRKARVYYIKALLQQGKYLNAVRELMSLASHVKESMFLSNDIIKLKKIISKREVRLPKGFLNDNFADKEKGYDYSRQQDFQYNDVFVVSLPALLRYADRNSMAFSIESRFPFLDYRLVEFCAGLSVNKKIYHGWSKYIMRKALEIPELIKNRKDKIGFATPEDMWLKRGSEYFKNIFRRETIRSERFIDKECLLEKWDSVLEKNNGAGLFRYICLELWMQKFEVE